MIFTEYQALARRTQNRRLTPDEKLRHALCGLPAEVGEICGHFQKVYQGHPLIVEKIAEEMGDALWFLGELADFLGLSLDDIARENIEKLKKRYPSGFDEEASLHREVRA